jgi:hypothetical protein
VQWVDDIDQRQDRQLEPVEVDVARHDRHVGLATLAEDRLDQGEREKHQGDRDGDRTRRVDVRARYALHMHPHDEGDDQRRTEVDEGEQRKEAAVDAFEVQEVADQRAVEHRQDIEPLGGGDDHELCQFVPDEHEAIDAGDVDQPQQGDAGQPGERAKATVAVVGEVPKHVQQHGQDHAVGGVAVNAAQDATRPPLLVRDPLHRFESVMHPGIGEDVEIKAGAHQQPELPEADRPQVIERVHLVAEGDVEKILDAHEQPAQDLLQDFDHGRCRFRRWVRRAGLLARSGAAGSVQLGWQDWRSFEEQATAVGVEVDHHDLARRKLDLRFLDEVEARFDQVVVHPDRELVGAGL